MCTNKIWGLCNFRNVSYCLSFANIYQIVKFYMTHYSMPNPTLIYFPHTTYSLFSLIQNVHIIWNSGCCFYQSNGVFLSYFKFIRLKFRIFPWSNICLTCRRLCFIFSTSKKFFSLSFSLERIVMSFPRILVEPSSPKYALPLFSLLII